MFAAAIFAVLALLMCMDGASVPIRGLDVGWTTHGALYAGKSPWPDSLEIVLLPGPRFFINSQEIPRGELQNELSRRLNQRVDWTVYFEAELDTLYDDTVFAINTIQKCGGKVFWITPRMRQGWAANPVVSGGSGTVHPATIP